MSNSVLHLERFINILVVDQEERHLRGFKEILSGGGNNVLTANSLYQAQDLLSTREIGILLLNIDQPGLSGMELLRDMNVYSRNKSIYKLIVTLSGNAANSLVKGLNEGAVDFINLPLNPNLVKAKIEVYKSLYHKDQRIGQLLANIFPESILEDLNTHGKFSPKRIEKGVVLFTDFIGFSQKARGLSPLKLLKKLEVYFTKFDEIMERYQIEKIKTIGDAYMAIAGATESTPLPEVRVCLAALEIRNFMLTEKQLALAEGKDFWEIRIGIHAGPLVAGIIGVKKFSFDIWGDTVNIASRAEQASLPNEIMITAAIQHVIEPYFELTFYDQIEIKKRGGSEEMYLLKELLPEYSRFSEGKKANKEMLEICGLSPIDFDSMQRYIYNKLKSGLPDELVYHDLSHTTNVERAAIRYAQLEGLSEYDICILRTAVYYHDAGFLVTYHNNEDFGMKLAQNTLSEFGYSPEEIRRVCSIIEATKPGVEPRNLLEQIMCDADHDYLGRADYEHVAGRLRLEMEHIGEAMSDRDWVSFQLHYLKNIHLYYTETANNIRFQGKQQRIQELEQQRKHLEQRS